RYIGVSELGVESMRRAASVHPLVDLQIEYSLLSRGPERTIFPLLRELGMATTAYGVLSRGLIAGSKPKAPSDFRANLPRFTGDNARDNQRLADALTALAQERGVTPVQLAIAWVRAKGEGLGVPVIPTIGARTRRHLDEALGALELTLSDEDVRTLEAAVPADAVAGSRYPDPLMAHLDSERTASQRGGALLVEGIEVLRCSHDQLLDLALTDLGSGELLDALHDLPEGGFRSFTCDKASKPTGVHLARQVERRIHRVEVWGARRLIRPPRHVDAPQQRLEAAGAGTFALPPNLVFPFDFDLALRMGALLEELLEHRAGPLEGSAPQHLFQLRVRLPAHFV